MRLRSSRFHQRRPLFSGQGEGAKCLACSIYLADIKGTLVHGEITGGGIGGKTRAWRASTPYPQLEPSIR
jgi:hypothetical protein